MEFVQPIRDLKQIETIKWILKQKSLRDYCLFVLGINSGLRISDLLRLRISDVSEKVNRKIGYDFERRKQTSLRISQYQTMPKVQSKNTSKQE